MSKRPMENNLEDNSSQSKKQKTAHAKTLMQYLQAISSAIPDIPPEEISPDMVGLALNISRQLYAKLQQQNLIPMHPGPLPSAPAEIPRAPSMDFKLAPPPAHSRLEVSAPPSLTPEQKVAILQTRLDQAISLARNNIPNRLTYIKAVNTALQRVFSADIKPESRFNIFKEISTTFILRRLVLQDSTIDIQHLIKVIALFKANPHDEFTIKQTDVLIKYLIENKPIQYIERKAWAEKLNVCLDLMRPGHTKIEYKKSKQKSDTEAYFLYPLLINELKDSACHFPNALENLLSCVEKVQKFISFQTRLTTFKKIFDEARLLSNPRFLRIFIKNLCRKDEPDSKSNKQELWKFLRTPIPNLQFTFDDLHILGLHQKTSIDYLNIFFFAIVQANVQELSRWLLSPATAMHLRWDLVISKYTINTNFDQGEQKILPFPVISRHFLSTHLAKEKPAILKQYLDSFTFTDSDTLQTYSQHFMTLFQGVPEEKDEGTLTFIEALATNASLLAEFKGKFDDLFKDIAGLLQTINIPLAVCNLIFQYLAFGDFFEKTFPKAAPATAPSPRLSTSPAALLVNNPQQATSIKDLPAQAPNPGTS